MIKLKYLPLYLALLAVSPSVFAQQAIITDRPSQSDGTYVLPKAVFQIETGLNYQIVDYTNMPVTTEHSFTFGSLFRLGLLDGLELRLITAPTSIQLRNPSGILESRSGVQDMQAGFKFRILDTRSVNPTNISLLGHLVAPTGTEGFSSNQAGFVGKLIISQQLNEVHGLLANLGYEYLGFDEGVFLMSLMWGITLDERLALFLEPYTRSVELIDWLLNADAGMTYRLTNNLQVDYTFGVGLNHDMNFHMVGMGILFPHKAN